MNVAGGKGEGVANKYKNKGLRVVAVDIDGSQKKESEKKWKEAGADFYLYDKDMNCLQMFYKDAPGFPYNVAIKEGKGKQIYDTEDGVKSAFGL